MKKRKTAPAALILAAAIAAVTALSSFGCVYVGPTEDGPTKVTDGGAANGGNTGGGNGSNTGSTGNANGSNTDGAGDANGGDETSGETVFGIGDTAEYRGVRVTLKSITESYGKEYMEPGEGKVFLVCEFEVENGSDKEINVSSVLSFEAYIDDYNASLDILACTSSGKETMDGTAAPGKKLAGAVGYEAPEGWQTVEIRFKANVWSDTAFIFKANKS